MFSNSILLINREAEDIAYPEIFNIFFINTNSASNYFLCKYNSIKCNN